ncbi:MAG: hypothetical protein A2157_17810 [Deltaproteobacteria bacterium RBG_16_47_11]|nr:MAG: hypothetical protein A2157_17810 [Deltaproteobacteria bacterium RBG_16_47_11]
MAQTQGIPRGAAVAIDDMLDHCARIQPGQEVLVLAQIDGLYGGDNLVDEQAICWIQAAIQNRGANASVLWIDEPVKPHAWRIPPIVRAALTSCDVLINHSFDLVVEEIIEFRNLISELDFIMVRNFATTAPLLCTAWAQTPHELVSEIRYQASVPFKEGVAWQLTDESGTHLEGIVGPSKNPLFPTYTTRRFEVGGYRPWPEWVIPPIHMTDTSGVVVFDRMLSWWSRYIGISPFFKEPIRLTIENCRITKIEGGLEADALQRFLETMVKRLGDGVYDFNEIHCGVHPQAIVGAHQCPSLIYRRLIEHSHACNIHFHIGAPPHTETYPYWMHCTGDIRTASWRVGDTLLHDKGHLTALDHPEVRAVAAKYPGRPGLEPQPWRY